MQAQEEGTPMFFRKRHPVRQSHIAIIGAGQIYLPAVGDQQALDSPRPVERKFLFVSITQNAPGAGLFASMTRIDNDAGMTLQTA